MRRIFSLFKRKKKGEMLTEDVPQEYLYAATCKKCGAVFWADSRSGIHWKKCAKCGGE